MSIQQAPAIEAMRNQMRAMISQLSATSLEPSIATSAQGGFAAELSRSLQRVSTMQHLATAQARDFELGSSDVALSDVMIDMQSAGLAFNATVQVRNRLVAAYQEIASMPV